MCVIINELLDDDGELLDDDSVVTSATIESRVLELTQNNGFILNLIFPYII